MLRIENIMSNFWIGWLVGCRFESICPLVGPGTIGGVPCGGLFKGS